MTSHPTLLPPDFQIRSRDSADTDRRHLLSESVAPSESASFVDYHAEDGERTPRPRSIAEITNEPNGVNRDAARRGTIADPTPIPYKGFPSEAHYMAALNSWAETKRYIEYDRTLIGFYGEKSIQDYANKPKLELGLRRKLRERKEKKEARRSTVV